MTDIPAAMHGVPRISGSEGRDKRPGFDAMHKEASRRKFDIVIAWSVDRLGRSLQDLIGFLSASALTSPCAQQGIETTTPEGGNFGSPFRLFEAGRRDLNLANSRATPQLSPITGTVFGEPTTERCQRSRPKGGAPCPTPITPGNIPCSACAPRRSAATWLQSLPRRRCGREFSRMADMWEELADQPAVEIRPDDNEADPE